MAVVVTGAAGFIGWRVCERLLEQAVDVVGLDNLSGYYDRRLKEWRLSTLKDEAGFTYYNIDVSAASELRSILKDSQIDAVIHLAARAGVRGSVTDPRPYVLDNVLSTANVLDCAVSASIQNVVLASSSSVYGNSSRPFTEDMRTDYPLSPYAASKRSAELVAYSYHKLFGMDITALRFFTVYGPAGRPDMSPFRFVRWIAEGEPVRIFGDGKQMRDFTFIDDVAAATIAALKFRGGYEIFNVGVDDPHTILDLVTEIELALGTTAQIEFTPRVSSDIEGTWADISKAKNLLSWSPSTSLKQGVKEMVGWYLENRSWAREIQLGEATTFERN